MSDDGSEAKGCGVMVFLVCAGIALIIVASAWARHLNGP